MATITYSVPGISCGHCVHTIEMEVGELAGVAQVSANQDTQIVTVSYEPPATSEQIEALLVEINYPPA